MDILDDSVDMIVTHTSFIVSGHGLECQLSRNFIGAGQKSIHSLLHNRLIACSEIILGSFVFNEHVTCLYANGIYTHDEWHMTFCFLDWNI